MSVLTAPGRDKCRAGVGVTVGAGGVISAAMTPR